MSELEGILQVVASLDRDGDGLRWQMPNSKEKTTEKTNNKEILMKIVKVNRRLRESGTTLIELSVVIAVILLLVGVLFIGVQAWRNGANASACLVNLASIQKAARGYQNQNLLNVGDALPHANLAGTSGYFGTLPTCPIGNTAYAYTDTVPAVNNAYAACAATGNGAPHVPTSLNNW